MNSLTQRIGTLSLRSSYASRRALTSVRGKVGAELPVPLFATQSSLCRLDALLSAISQCRFKSTTPNATVPTNSGVTASQLVTATAASAYRIEDADGTEIEDKLVVSTKAYRGFSLPPRPSNVDPTNLSPQKVLGPDGRMHIWSPWFDVGQNINGNRMAKRRIKPKIVRKRRAKLKTYIGAEKNIRHSPFRLNLVCQLAAGLPLEEALQQLEFCTKVKAPLVHKVLKRTSNLADIRDGIQISQLEVAECFATHGHHLKRMRIMGRGHSGIMHHRHSHMRVVLREIDFPFKIVTAKSIRQKRKWAERQFRAERDYALAKAERDSIQQLEEQVAAQQKKKEEGSN